jgi:hypothetical protein
MNKLPETSIDYPAAHSMDTMWFAVDRDGNVAAFDSAEGGAVPNSALSEHEMDVLEALADIGNESEVIHAHEDHRYPLNTTYLHTQPHKKWRKTEPPAKSLWSRLFGGLRSAQPALAEQAPAGDEFELHLPLIMFFSKASDAEPWLEKLDCKIVESTEGCAVIFNELPLEVHRIVHDQNLCRACVNIYMFEDEESHHDNPSALGLYFYTCCEAQMAYPYGRVSLPKRPLRLEQLPQDLQERLVQVRFNDISFAVTRYIQPAERVESSTWDGGYLSADWKHYRANPGQEDQYKEIYLSMKECEDQDGIEYMPPS